MIPARFDSSRLPGKPLLEAGGRSLIHHVYSRVAAARRVRDVVVATDDPRIVAAVEAFGGRARMTSSAHATGSDRIGELLPGLDAEIILNVQGDEPEVPSALLDALICALEEDPSAEVATAAAPFPPGADPADPNAVKVVTDRRGFALYFSRALIPWPRSPAVAGDPADGPRLHVGVYAYRRSALEGFLAAPRGRLEQRESLEQLRLLENGVPIRVVPVDRAFPGIDTPEDLEAFRRRMREAVPNDDTPDARRAPRGGTHA